MAQITRFNWLDDDLTISLNKFQQAAILYGLYYGFDWQYDPSLTATFIHTLSGYEIVNSDSPITVTPNVGEWRTKQGGVVQETEPITAVFDIPDTQDRIDLLVGQHNYVPVAGGAVAVYTVIKGTPSATPVAPALTLPNEQVILGEMFIPGGGSDLSDATFTKAVKPDFGGDTSIAHLERIQRFTREQIIPQFTSEWGVCYLDTTNNLIDLSKDPSGALLTGEQLTINLKKNNFVIEDIGTTTVIVNSIIPYPHDFTKECKDVRIFTFSPLSLNGSAFFTSHSNNNKVRAFTTLELSTIQDTYGTGTFAGAWTVKSGVEALIDGDNMFTATNSWPKRTGVISGTGVLQHNSLANYIEATTTPSTSTLKAIEPYSSTGGTYMVIKGTGEPLTLVHDSPDPITKTLWLPTEKDFTSYSDSEVFLFIEDVNYWRLVGTYNQIDDWHYVGDATTGLGTTFTDYNNALTAPHVTNLRFKKSPDNKLSIQGYINKNVVTDTVNTQVCILPSDYIPEASLRYYLVDAVMYDSSTGNNVYSAPARVIIGANGALNITSYGAFNILSGTTFTCSNVFINLTIPLD